MYKIKQIPEDFIVRELNTELKTGNSGNLSYFLMKKTDYTTERAVQAIANLFNIKRKFISYAGNKDKNAVTYQYISIGGLNPSQEKDHHLKDIELKFLGKGNQQIYLGFLTGNIFEIIVRNLDKGFKVNNENKILNLFGEQRFSSNNALIGKNIVQDNFKAAVDIMIKENGDYEDDLKDYLKQNTNDYIGALRTIPRKILTLFVNSYQSLIFNETIERYTKERPDCKNINVPIIGFGTEFNDPKIEDIVQNIMKRENIALRDFIIRKIPELSSEGGERGIFLDIKSLKIGKPGPDDLNKGKQKVKLTFQLDKGSYATIVIKNLFG